MVRLEVDHTFIGVKQIPLLFKLVAGIEILNFKRLEKTYKISHNALVRSHEHFLVQLKDRVSEATHLLQRGTIVLAGGLESAVRKA